MINRDGAGRWREEGRRAMLCYRKVFVYLGDTLEISDELNYNKPGGVECSRGRESNVQTEKVCEITRKQMRK